MINTDDLKMKLTYEHNVWNLTIVLSNRPLMLRQNVGMNITSNNACAHCQRYTNNWPCAPAIHKQLTMCASDTQTIDHVRQRYTNNWPCVPVIHKQLTMCASDTQTIDHVRQRYTNNWPTHEWVIPEAGAYLAAGVGGALVFTREGQVSQVIEAHARVVRRHQHLQEQHSTVLLSDFTLVTMLWRKHGDFWGQSNLCLPNSVIVYQ